MGKIDIAFQLSEDQRTRKQKFFKFSIDHIIIMRDLTSKFCWTHLFENFIKKLPSNMCFCSRQTRVKNSRWRYHMPIARYATLAIMSMMLILAFAQDENLETLVVNSNALNASINWSSNRNQSHFETNTQNESETFTNSSKVSNQNNNNNNYNGYMPSGPGILRGASVNRNSLINGDTLLQRQLREKAKQDSLQSIKMHILMRLNLKKLPSITKPISVPQNILENFYKKYNASLLNSMWPHDKPELENAPEKRLNVEKNRSSTKPTSTKDSNIFRPIANLSMEEMLGDDPNQFGDYEISHNFGLGKKKEGSVFDNHGTSDYSIIDNDNGEYESILSHIKSIYVFPEQPHTRHNRKADVLRFKFDNYAEISYVKLHLYLRGLDWIRANQPNIINEMTTDDDDYTDKEIVVAVHRAIRRVNNTNYTHKLKIFEFRHKIPIGSGQWISVNLKPLFVTGQENTILNSSKPNQTQEIVIKGVEPWMKPLVVTTDNTSKNPLTVHIEIGSQKKHRRKRSVFMDCSESDHDMRCCRYPLKVNFTSFGWHFVVAPTSFDAYFCSGDCRVGYLEQYPHTHLAALTTSATPCCSPTKMSSLSLLYFDDNHNLVLSVIPNMSVEGCSCS